VKKRRIKGTERNALGWPGLECWRDEEVLARGIRYLFVSLKSGLDRKHRGNLATEMAHPLFRPASRFSHHCSE